MALLLLPLLVVSTSLDGGPVRLVAVEKLAEKGGVLAHHSAAVSGRCVYACVFFQICQICQWPLHAVMPSLGLPNQSQ